MKLNIISFIFEGRLYCLILVDCWFRFFKFFDCLREIKNLGLEVKLFSK